MTAISTHRPITLQPLEDEASIHALTDELMLLASQMHIKLSYSQANICIRHLLYVNQVNEYINLTRITDIHEALVLHILDSLAIASVLPSIPNRFLDMGTGAGFPGIPFGVISGTPGVLLDSVGKKVDAVNSFIQELGLTCLQGVHDRLESYALNNQSAFDLVFARAVGQLSLLIEYAAPFLSMNGHLVLAKAVPSIEELNSGLRTAEICGLKLITDHQFDLPNELGHRTVLVYKKVANSKVKLPRAVGQAKKTPLA